MRVGPAGVGGASIVTLTNKSQCGIVESELELSSLSSHLVGNDLGKLSTLHR